MAQFNQLSDREWDVVNLLLEGKSNKLIASSLSISERTVEFHLKNIYTKLQVSSRIELVVKLGNTTDRLESEKPGFSTVAGKGEVAENRDRLNLWNWAASLRETVSTFGKELKMKSTLNSNAHSEGNPMTFFESIRVCFTKYADFNGRATRAEFWWFMLFITLVTAALVYISETLGSIFLIAMLLPLLAAGSRRLRDSGKSAWLQLYLLVPVGGIIMLGFWWALPPTSPLPDETLPV
jgi:DNA-binding CsgD family transcriptional regulator